MLCDTTSIHLGGQSMESTDAQLQRLWRGNEVQWHPVSRGQRATLPLGGVCMCVTCVLCLRCENGVAGLMQSCLHESGCCNS